MSFTGIFHSIAVYNIRSFQVSDINNEYNDNIYIMARIITCIISIILCLIFLIIIKYTYIQRIIIITYMIFRSNEAFIDVLHGIDQKHWRMDYISISLIIRGISMLSVFIILGLFFELYFAIIGMVIITFLIGFLFDIQKTKKLTNIFLKFDKRIFILLKQCFPLMLVILIGVLILSYSRYSIERLLGTEALGIYASVSAPALIIQVAASFIFLPLINVFASYLKEINFKKYINIFIIISIALLLISIFIYIIFVLFGDFCLSILFGDSIKPYSYLLSGAVIVAGLTAFMWFMNMIFSTIRDIKGILIGNILGLIICLIFTNIFLNNYGLIGANYIMILSQGIAVLFLFIRFFWFVKFKLSTLFLKHNNIS